MNNERKRLLLIIADHGRRKTLAKAAGDRQAALFHMAQERLWRKALADREKIGSVVGGAVQALATRMR